MYAIVSTVPTTVCFLPQQDEAFTATLCALRRLGLRARFVGLALYQGCMCSRSVNLVGGRVAIVYVHTSILLLVAEPRVGGKI